MRCTTRLAVLIRIKQYQEEKKELLESLELYYRVFFLGEEVPEEALMEEDGGSRMENRNVHCKRCRH